MKILYIVTILVVTLTKVQAIEYNHSPYISTTTSTSSEGIAASIAASQHVFAYGLSSLQGSVAVGTYDNNTAFSFGLAKKFGKSLVNGSVSNENGKLGIGAAINLHF